MGLPPGPVYVVKRLGSSLRACLLTYTLLWTLSHLEAFKSLYSSALLLLLSLLLHPVLNVAKRVFLKVKSQRQAANLGAVFPPSVPQSGYLIVQDMLKDFQSNYIGDLFLKWHALHGPTFMLQIYSEIRILTCEPAHLKTILATQANNFIKGTLLNQQWKSLLGSGVFIADGEAWKFHRSMTRPFFSKDRVRDFEIFDTHAIETIRQMQVRMSGGHPIDFQDVVARFTLDCATEFLFGKNVESLAAGLPYPKHSGICNPASFTEHVSNPFTTAFSEGQNIITRRNRTGKTWPLMEFWRDEAAERRKVVEEFARPLLDEAKKSILHDANEKRNSDGETFLQHLVHFTQDDKVIMDSIINILLASRDTTASLLTFALYMLTEHRDLAQRMRDEVMEHVGETKSPTYEDIRGMKLMRAFLNETLRLYPPAPNNSRTSVKATTLVNENGPPLFVPENCKVMYNVFLIHRRRDLWGPDADQFDPDRFLDERLHRYLVPNPFIFLPFGAGPRICLGQQFACNETSFFLVRLLQNFKSFTLALEAQPEFCKPPADWKGYPGTKGRDKIVPTAHLTMSVKGGLWVRME